MNQHIHSPLWDTRTTQKWSARTIIMPTTHIVVPHVCWRCCCSASTYIRNIERALPYHTLIHFSKRCFFIFTSILLSTLQDSPNGTTLSDTPHKSRSPQYKVGEFAGRVNDVVYAVWSENIFLVYYNIIIHLEI